MKVLQGFLLFLGRLCISGIFIISAMHKILDWQATERGWVAMFYDWQNYASFSLPLQDLFTTFLQNVPWILGVGIALELLGALMILIGIKVRLGAVFLFFFLIFTTLLFHPFWFLDGVRREMQQILFLKNIAIMGGLLVLMTFGGKIHRCYSYNMPVDTSEHG